MADEPNSAYTTDTSEEELDTESATSVSLAPTSVPNVSGSGSASRTKESSTSSQPLAPDSASESSGIPSLLSRLRSPQPAEISRKRKTVVNPPRGKRRSHGRSNFNPRSVAPAQRVKEFPEEPINVSAGKLFCKACKEELSTKLSVLKNHLKSKKHAEATKKLEKSDKRERDIAQALVVYDESRPRGETLPTDQRVYRVKVVTAFLKAGVPLSKIDCFRDLLEERAFRLTDRRHLADLVPFILKDEQEKLKNEITGRELSVIFDGTTRLGEAMAVVVLFVSDDWSLEQRLLQLKTLAKSMTGEEIAREVLGVLSTNYGVGSYQLCAAIRDRASVNNVAVRAIKVLYPHLLDVGCFSHTIDHVGEHFKTPVLIPFMTSWVSLFSHSPKARLLWKQQTGKSMATYSATRWWSKWEVMKQLMVQFGDVVPFLTSDEEFAPALKPKLLSVLQDPTKSKLLQLELAATIDAGEPFVKATYRLEGDGPLALECYEIVATVQVAIHSNHYPNVTVLAQQFSGGNTVARNQFVQYAQSCVKPGQDYFNTQLQQSLKESLSAFKAARLLSPHKVTEMLPVASDVDQLSSFPFVSSSMLASLKAELPAYIAKADGIDNKYCALQWWKSNAAELPHWSALARKVLLVQPSSAAAERVFSILSNSFGDRKLNALEDYLEISVMLQYNKH